MNKLALLAAVALGVTAVYTRVPTAAAQGDDRARDHRDQDDKRDHKRDDRARDHRRDDRARDHRKPKSPPPPPPRRDGQPPLDPGIGDGKHPGQTPGNERVPARRGDRPHDPGIAVGEPHPGSGNERVPAHRGDRRDPRRGRAVVSGYWPRKGDAGTVVTIRGYGFAPQTQVVFGGRTIPPTQATPTRIQFAIPRGHKDKDGTIALRAPRARRDLVVGGFEVVKKYDAKAERKRIRDQRHKAAEQRWNDRKSKLAKDRAARLEAMRQREAELAKSRAQRRQERIRAARAAWKKAFLADPETQAELALHAERVARLERMRRLAEVDDHGKLVIRIEILLDRENDRHERRMKALEGAYQAN